MLVAYKDFVKATMCPLNLDLPKSAKPALSLWLRIPTYVRLSKR